MKKPNILLIMTDQQRYDSLGCYGCESVETPNLDKLAQEGALFENCYVNNPICTPSRASIFTGKPLTGHGVYRLYDILPKDQTLFPQKLKEKGYETALIGKLHVSGAVYERDRRNPMDGFDIYDWCHEPAIFLDGEYNAYGKWLREKHPSVYEQLKQEGRDMTDIPAEAHFSSWVSSRAIEYIENRNNERPFFCMMSFFDPHNPYSDYPQEALRGVNKDNLTMSIKKEGEAHTAPEGVLREHEGGYMGSYHNYSSDDIYQMRLGYYASIGFLDQQVGRVMEVLENQGIKDETLVIFVSDHGDMLGDHELLAKGAFFYDACTKVPLILRYPNKIKAGECIQEMVQPHDLTATILAQAGYEKRELESMMPDSMNLIDILDNTERGDSYRDYAVCLYRGTGICDRKEYFDPPIQGTMYREKRYKLNIYHHFNPITSRVQGQLFDMWEDPQEEKDLWDDPEYSILKMELMSSLMNWMVRCDVYYNGSRGGQCGTVNQNLLR